MRFFFGLSAAGLVPSFANWAARGIPTCIRLLGNRMEAWLGLRHHKEP